jgi:hypothetical protein
VWNEEIEIALFLQMCVCTKKGMWPIATEIGSASGLRGYYRGYKSAIANAMISSALGFAVYQKVLSQYKKVSGSRQASPAVKGVCAGELLFCSVWSLKLTIAVAQASCSECFEKLTAFDRI